MKRGTMRLFIADDNVPYRTVLTSMFSEMKGISVVGSAGNVSEAVEGIIRLHPDAIILDLQMPGGSGLDVLRVAKSFSPAPTVIMLTMGPRSEYETASYVTGADYFFEKSSELRRMTRLVKKLARSSVA